VNITAEGLASTTARASTLQTKKRMLMNVLERLAVVRDEPSREALRARARHLVEDLRRHVRRDEDPSWCPKCQCMEGAASAAADDSAALVAYRCKSCGHVWALSQRQVREREAAERRDAVTS
jgi:hypothetical protein